MAVRRRPSLCTDMLSLLLVCLPFLLCCSLLFSFLFDFSCEVKRSNPKRMIVADIKSNGIYTRTFASVTMTGVNDDWQRWTMKQIYVRSSIAIAQRSIERWIFKKNEISASVLQRGTLLSIGYGCSYLLTHSRITDISVINRDLSSKL